MDPKDVAKFDQSTEFITKSFPALWRGLYLNLVESGFSETQAMDLLKTYILSMGSGR